MAGSPRVGVLALQGDFREHLAVLENIGARAVAVRRAEDVQRIDGVVLPGGESTVIDKLAREFGVAEPLRAALQQGLPAFGTCAGLIMLATDLVDGAEDQLTFGVLDATVRRNAFGSQISSFETELHVRAIGDPPMHATFIRAPVIERVGPGVTELAALADGRVVAVEQGNIVACAFHPELAGDPRLHQYFLQKVTGQD